MSLSDSINSLSNNLDYLNNNLNKLENRANSMNHNNTTLNSAMISDSTRSGYNVSTRSGYNMSNLPMNLTKNHSKMLAHQDSGDTAITASNTSSLASSLAGTRR